MFPAHALYLTIATALTYLWVNHPTYSPYTLQLVAILILLYFATHFLSRRSPQRSRQVITIDLIIMTIIILLLVTQTGGLASPLMFTIYFLLFAVALLFEIQATLLLTAVLIVYLTLLPSTNLTDLPHLTELFALVMITPLAIFTGHQYEKVLAEQQHLSKEETDTLLFLNLNLKQTLTRTLDQLSFLIPKIPGYHNQTDLKQIYQDLRALYQSAQKLAQDIDLETDHES